jgi:hypothetical protein
MEGIMGCLKYSAIDEFLDAVGFLGLEESRKIVKRNLDDDEAEELLSCMTEDGSFYAHSTSATYLLKILEKNPDIHIATETSDGDADDVNDSSTVIYNRYALVNRERYYLCNGDDNEELFCNEPF